MGTESFKGVGPGKELAKNIAAEDAVAAFISTKYGKMDEQTEMDDQTQLTFNSTWEGLCSLAIHKLFSEWNDQGMVLPEKFTSGCLLRHVEVPEARTKSAVQQGSVTIDPLMKNYAQMMTPFGYLAPSRPQPLTTLRNANSKKLTKQPWNKTRTPDEKKHPNLLLNEKLKGREFEYEEESFGVGKHKYQNHNVTLRLDGFVTEYKGSASSKKEAKRQCAISVLKGMFDIDLSDQPPGGW